MSKNMVNVKVGDEIIIIRGEARRKIRARVTHVARVWFDAAAIDNPNYTWHLHRGSQSVRANPEHWDTRFRTLKQEEEHEEKEQAGVTLRAMRIVVEPGSPWFRRKAELASLLADHLDAEGAREA